MLIDCCKKKVPTVGGFSWLLADRRFSLVTRNFCFLSHNRALEIVKPKIQAKVNFRPWIVGFTSCGSKFNVSAAQ